VITDSSIEILDRVYFKTNKAVIEKRSYPLLDNVAAVIVAHTEVGRVRVEGHTDNRGRPRWNTTLSQSRAESVVDYLVRKGVPRARLEAKGFGPSAPIADNGTEEGRAKNRRVEFKLVGAKGTVQSRDSEVQHDTIGH
jgi:outer membrane protein OmpA-like peptidoglycan-associated protein